MRPLPRSLDPLPDETLTGFVLRLAHRLGTTPAEVVRRTGLAPGDRSGLSLSFQHHLDDAHLTDFARATHLTPAEVTDMLLAPFGQRYGPLNPAFTPRVTPARMIYDNPWVLTRSTRYCPPCLAGNGALIQDLHGGPWQRLWRLPVIFLCIQHRRLLQHECPGCGTPVHSVRRANANAIARLSDDMLHPWQCRFPIRPTQHLPETACATDLTRLDPPSLEPDTVTMTVLLQLQQQLVDLLKAGGPETVMSAGAPVPAAHYFADLRAAVAMIFRTWPEARPYARTPVLAAALDTEHDFRAALAQPLLNTPGKKQTSRPYTTPPTDSLATGAVLDIASQLLGTEHPDEARELLAPLVMRLRDRDRALSIYLRRSAWISMPLRAAVADDGWERGRKPATSRS